MCNRVYTLHKGYMILKPDICSSMQSSHLQIWQVQNATSIALTSILPISAAAIQLRLRNASSALNHLHAHGHHPQFRSLGVAGHFLSVLNLIRAASILLTGWWVPLCHLLETLWVSAFLSQASSSKETFRHESNRTLYGHIPIISSILLSGIVQHHIFNTSNEAFMEWKQCLHMFLHQSVRCDSLRCEERKSDVRRSAPVGRLDMFPVTVTQLLCHMTPSGIWETAGSYSMGPFFSISSFTATFRVCRIAAIAPP